MTLGEKIKNIRKRFGLSQEKLAEILNVSRQAITKWESDGGFPDTANLVEISKIFGVTIDYLINSDSELPLLVMRTVIDKDKYKNKLDGYYEYLKDNYSELWEVYSLSRTKKMNVLEMILDFFGTMGNYHRIEALSDLSPYYLVTKDNLKLLVSIRNWKVEVNELDSNVNIQKFFVGRNKFTNAGKIKFK